MAAKFSAPSQYTTPQRQHNHPEFSRHNSFAKKWNYASNNYQTSFESTLTHLKRLGLFPLKQPNGIYSLRYCPNCNKHGQLPHQRIAISAKTAGYSCNTCAQTGNVQQLVEGMKEQDASADGREPTSLRDAASLGSRTAAAEKQPVLPIERLLEVPLENFDKIEALITCHFLLTSPLLEAFGLKVFLDETTHQFYLRYPMLRLHPEAGLQTAGFCFANISRNSTAAADFAEDFFVPVDASPEEETAFHASADRFMLFSPPQLQQQSRQSPNLLLVESVLDFLAICRHISDALPHKPQLAAYDVLFVPSHRLPFFSCANLHSYEKVLFWTDVRNAAAQEKYRSMWTEISFLKCFVRSAEDATSAFAAAAEGRLTSVEAESFVPVPHPKVFSAERRFLASAWSWQKIEDEIAAHKKVAFPIKSLPRLSTLTKGFRAGELTVFSGPTGSGKTTFLSQLTLDYCLQGIGTLWGSFEIRNSRLIGKMLQQLSPTPLIDVPRDELTKLQQNFHALNMNFMNFFGSTLIDEVLEACEYAIRMYGVQHVVLDNLQFMLSGQDSGNVDKFSIADKVLGMLRDFCTRRNVHITLVIHPRKEEGDRLVLNSISGTAKATQEADNVLILQNVDDFEGRFIDVKKNRYDGTVGSVPLGFERTKQVFYEMDAAETKAATKSKVPAAYAAKYGARGGSSAAANGGT